METRRCLWKKLFPEDRQSTSGADAGHDSIGGSDLNRQDIGREPENTIAGADDI